MMELRDFLQVMVSSVAVLLLIMAAVEAVPSVSPGNSTGMSNNNMILLKNARLDTAELQPAGSRFAIRSYPPDVKRYYIVQFRGYIREEWKQGLRDAGAVIFDYVPNNAFVVRMNLSEGNGGKTGCCAVGRCIPACIQGKSCAEYREHSQWWPL